MVCKSSGAGLALLGELARGLDAQVGVLLWRAGVGAASGAGPGMAMHAERLYERIGRESTRRTPKRTSTRVGIASAKAPNAAFERVVTRSNRAAEAATRARAPRHQCLRDHSTDSTDGTGTSSTGTN